ncbi:hypothetical protein M0R45_009096 [Rubus argutus]|uniref:Uncharacterized protein n=1 Tax=Rubus argutus TaxID=59490 RepID=A0AAW1Y3I4_RUBAR
MKTTRGEMVIGRVRRGHGGDDLGEQRRLWKGATRAGLTKSWLGTVRCAAADLSGRRTLEEDAGERRAGSRQTTPSGAERGLRTGQIDLTRGRYCSEDGGMGMEAVCVTRRSRRKLFGIGDCERRQENWLGAGGVKSWLGHE